MTQRTPELDDSTVVGSGTRTPNRGPRPAPEFEEGDRVGRYVLLGSVGAGGMGVVFAAYDPQLDRKVALKVLHRVHGVRPADGEARLIREAKATARVTHPNVVALHDVGVHEGQVFLSMEFIDGETLGAWCKARTGHWREIVERFVQAGRGLAAAHAAGIVHRDFKPENAMVGADGRVRVMDFGLARGLGERVATTDNDDEVDPPDLGASLTASGHVVGTPAYMSPEQLQGEPVDAQSDQFSYCVALYRALFGQPPFRSGSMQELYVSVTSEEPRPLPSGHGVPSPVAAVVLRGLARAPQDRFDSMPSLIRALVRAAGRRRRWGVITGGVAIVGAATLAGAFASGDRDPCQRRASIREEIWTPTQRDAVVIAIRGSELPYAEAAQTATLQGLDAFAEGWADSRRDACEATHLRGEQSELGLDARVRCLDQARVEVNATVELLAAGDTATMERAVDLIGDLPSLARCRDVAALLDREALPADREQRQQIEALSARTSRGRVLRRAGQTEAARSLLADVAGEVDDATHAPLRAAARLEYSFTLADAGEVEEAEAEAVSALAAAMEANDVGIAVDAALKLAIMVGDTPARSADAEHWERLARDLIQRLSDPGPRFAELRRVQAIRLYEAGKYDESLAAAREALAMVTELYGEDSVEAAKVHHRLGVTLADLGRGEEGLEHSRRAVEIERGIFGATHPRTIASLTGLGIVHGQLRRYGDSRTALEAALAAQAQLGPDDLVTARILTNLGELQSIEGDPAGSLEFHNRALAIRERLLPANHLDVTRSLTNSGTALEALERYDEARVRLERALAIRREALGDSHPLVAQTQISLAYTCAKTGEGEVGYTHAIAARDTFAEALGPRHPNVAIGLIAAATCLVASGDKQGGIALAREAVELMETELGEAHPDAAVVRNQLAALSK